MIEYETSDRNNHNIKANGGIIMSIDIIKAKKAFKEYVKNYDPNDKKVKLKIAHIERVSQIAKQLAENLNLDEEDVKLAELIGLLHDIGRFEQIKRYHTFIDKNSVNHGELGAKILFEEGLIRDFIEDTKFDEIIKLSILNHNKTTIQEGLTQREELHAKIIRDADKTDILYLLTFEDKQAAWEKDDLSNDKITDEIYREFMEDKKIDYTKRETSADLLVCHFAYAYDLNFKETYKIIKENKYYDEIYIRFIFNNKETMERYNKIYEKVKQYIEEKG